MKDFTLMSCYFLLLLCLLCIGLFSGQAKAQTDAKPVTGHFANAHKTATLILKSPKLDKTETGCIGGCLTRITFSDPTIPPIEVNGCMGGELANLGDLNGDGLDEIGLLPGWFAGCWRNYHVYTFKHGQWHLAVPPFPTHCNEFEAAGVKPIVKDTQKSGYVLVTYSVFKGNDIVFETKSEPVK